MADILIADDDPFNILPNSVGTNPGNDLSVIDIGTPGLPSYFYTGIYGYAFSCDDSDLDGILDEVEDANHDGIVDAGETDPFNADSDGDNIEDGVEDANHNGQVDAGETDPTDKCDPNATFAECDFDGDGDNNMTDLDDDGDGVADVDDIDDFNKDSDSDFDGISDDDETGNDGVYDAGVDSDPLNPCDPDPNALACTGTDADGDGFYANVASGDPLFDSDDTNPCIPLAASPQYSNGAQYIWTGNNLPPFAPTVQTVTLVPNTTGNLEYTFAAVVNGCTTSVATVNVLVEAIPPVDITIDGDTECVDGTTTVTLIPNSTGATSWTWTNQAGTVVGTGENLVFNNATSANSGTYTVVVSNSLGCTASGSTTLTITNFSSYNLITVWAIIT